MAVFGILGTVLPKAAVGLCKLNLGVFGVKATRVMVSHFHQKLSVSALKHCFGFFFPFFPPSATLNFFLLKLETVKKFKICQGRGIFNI